jgi:hypothetical protein
MCARSVKDIGDNKKLLEYKCDACGKTEYRVFRDMDDDFINLYKKEYNEIKGCKDE